MQGGGGGGGGEAELLTSRTLLLVLRVPAPSVLIPPLCAVYFFLMQNTTVKIHIQSCQSPDFFKASLHFSLLQNISAQIISLLYRSS